MKEWSPILLGAVQVLTAVTLAVLTYYLFKATREYANQVAIQTGIMNNQVTAVQNQIIAMENQGTVMHNRVAVMQDQLSFERTFRPRLDAYKRFMDKMSFRPIDEKYKRDHLVPELKLVRPFSSGEVKNIVDEIYGSAVTKEGIKIPANFDEQIKEKLLPKMGTEIEDIIQTSVQ